MLLWWAGSSDEQLVEITTIHLNTFALYFAYVDSGAVKLS